MDLVILPQHWSAFLCIAIIISVLLVAIVKKYMMTFALIVTNIILFIITFIFYEELVYGFSDGSFKYAGLAFRAVYLNFEHIPQLYTLFTSQFLHSGFLHLFGNMLTFFFVGLPFEQRIGWKKFILIYLLTGVIAAISHSLTDLGSPIPLLGASGAIFGIMGAFAASYPRDEVVMPIPLGFIMILRRIKVMYAVLIFAALETVIVFLDVQDQTAHFAHLGGLIGGVVLALIFLRGRRTHTKKGETIYYDSYQAQRPRNINYSNLEKIAKTEDQKQMLEKIKNESVPQVKDIWLEHFLDKLNCPKCGSKLNHFNKKIWCKNCNFKSNY